MYDCSSCGNGWDVSRRSAQPDPGYVCVALRFSVSKVRLGRGKVKAKVVEDRKAETLKREIAGIVEKGFIVFTDDWKSYNCLIDSDYEHATVNHSAKEFVRGMASTNGI